MAKRKKPVPARRRAAKTRSRTAGKAAVSKKKRKRNPMTEQDLSATNLNQIRNILFGEQVRENAKRFEKIEARLAKDLTNLKNEVGKRLDALEKSVAKNYQDLAGQVEDEAIEREEAQKAFAKQLTELTSRVRQVDEMHTRATRKLREFLSKEDKATREELQQKLDDLAAEMEAGLEELQGTSVGKEDLSSYFADIALRLVNKKQIRRQQ